MIKRVGVAVALLALCLAAAPAGAGDPLLSDLGESAKLQAPEEILAELAGGEPEAAVIVYLRPTPAAAELAARSRAAGPVPEGFGGPGAATYYNLEDESIGAELRATVAEQVGRVVDEIGPYGMTVTQRFSYQFGFAARVTPAALGRILAAPDVIAVEKDASLREHLKQGIPLMNAAAARSAYRGAGVSIAICDTGIDTRHPRLGGTGDDSDPKFNAKVLGGYDTGDNDDDPRPGSSADGYAGSAHGTACAGIAAGSLGPAGDYIGGVAPLAKLYAVKISYGTGGNARTSAMIAGWEWCITHKNDNPANPLKVVSTSFGGSRFTSTCDGYSSGMTTAAANAVAAGISLFVSSGNDGYCDSTAWPACISHVNSVGAVYDAGFGSASWCVSAGSCAPKTATGGCDSGYYATDATGPNKVTSYSNSASFLTLFSPSNNAYTTDIFGAGGYAAGDYDSEFGGTSAAAPYAAGAAAVLQSAARAKTGKFLTPAQVRGYLVTHGDPITDAKVPSVTQPRVNLGRAADAIAMVPGALQFSSSEFSVSEGVTTATIKVARTGNSYGAVGVSYATSNDVAVAGKDYTATSGTLSWASRDLAAKSFTVTILDDARDEANENFRVALSAPTGGAALGSRSVAGVTIQDNDPAPTVQFDAAAASTPESTPAAAIGVSLSAPSDLTVQVNYATANGTATASDYTPTSGTLTFAPGVTTRQISVPIFNDLREEADEVFTVALTAPVKATLGAAATHTCTIANDDAPPTVQFQRDASSGAESVTPASIEVVLSTATWQTVTVGYVTADGSAVAGEDYTAKSGTLTFNPGVMSRTIEVPIVASPTAEPSELFAVVLTSPTNASLGAPGSHLYTILDQNTYGVIRLSVPGYPVNEAGPTVTVTAVRAGGATGAVGVGYATGNGTAKAGSDYTAKTGTLSWAAGDTANKTFRVSITDDAVKDANETFTVRLSAPTGGAVLGTPESATIVILDND